MAACPNFNMASVTPTRAGAAAQQSTAIVGTTPSLFERRERVAFRRFNQDNYTVSTGKLSCAIDLKNCTGLELWYAGIPRTPYTIDTNYNSFIVHRGVTGDSTTVTLTNQNYTVAQLQTAINAALPANITVSAIDTQANKFTFTASGGETIALEFGSQHIAAVLGFGQDSVYYPARTDPDVVVYTAADATFDSPYQYDLGGARYLRFDCPALEHAYSDSGIIDDLPFTGDITFSASMNNLTRRFIHPAKLDTIEIDLSVLFPDGSTAIFDNHGSGFNVCCVVFTEILARNFKTSVMED